VPDDVESKAELRTACLVWCRAIAAIIAHWDELRSNFEMAIATRWMNQ
jgi:hypothetical protein